MTATMLLPLAVAWPIALALLLLVHRLRRLALQLSATMGLPALLLAFLPESAVELHAPGLFTSMLLGVDTTGRPFLLLTALLWSIVPLQSHAYMRHDAQRVSFTAFLLATGAGNIGLTIAQDALSFYLFFAVMTFAAYGLVVHTRTPEALRAGRIYIMMAVFGEGLLLAGLFAITAVAADATFARVPEAYAALARPGIIATALVLGFGVKAGLLPLHLWLPLAHPVAPTPASALLSGAMIKAGVLGWLRFLPIGQAAFDTLGAALLIAGVVATLFGAVVGVTQRDAKTVLAYSSISQMGFLTTAVGGALIVPAAAPLLILAVAVYALHHAIAKAALFLAVALAPLRFTRAAWHLVAGCALPALVLAGAPLTSGALAKAALKGALAELPHAWIGRIDLLLTVAAVGTTLLMARFLTALSRAPAHAHNRGPGVLVPWLVLVLLSGFAGVWLTWALAPLGELPLATDPGYVAAALWPVALGTVLALSTRWLLRRFPALTVPTIPAGDIVAVLGRMSAAGRRRLSVVRELPLAERRTLLVRRISGAARVALDRSAERIESAHAGVGLGVILCVLVVALLVALR